MAFTVIWHHRAREISGDLWDSFFRSPAERRWWYAALEGGKIAEQFEFFFGEIRKQGETVGIVPAFVTNVPMELVAPPPAMKILRALGPLGKPFLTQRTLFIGNIAGEGGAVGLARGLNLGDVATDIHAAAWKLRRRLGAKLVVWKDFLSTDSTQLAEPLAGAGYFRLVSYPATLIDLPTGGIEAYLKSLDGDYRYKLRKKLKAGAGIALETQHLQHPTPEQRAEIWGLFWQTYERGTTKFEQFNPAVFDRFAEHPGSHWVVLRRRDDGVAVAFMLLTEEGDHWVNRFIGMDYAQPKELFLYYRLFVEAVGVCATHHRPHLLSGQTGYRPKLELGHRLLPMDNFTRHRNPLMHFIYAKVAATITWSTLDEDLKVYLTAHPKADTSRQHWA